MLPVFDDYARLVAGLPSQFPSIQSSTLSVYTIGPLTAEVQGQISFAQGLVLSVWELIDLSTSAIRSYSYELDRGDERLWWYDAMEHPNDPALASTSPHHKHVPPDIKHHRLPAPEISFSQSNLPTLVADVERLLLE